MKPVLFIVFFTLGVTLMVFSGYLPHSASAHGNGAAGGLAPREGKVDRPPAEFTVTRRVLSHAEDTPQPTQGESEAPSSAVAPAEEAAQPPSPQEAQPAPEAPTPAEAPSAPAPVADAPDQSTAANEAPPVADAGPDRVVWAGWDELPLDGSASSGRGLTYRWQQTAGPRDLVIKNPAHAVTTASGLLGDGRQSWRTSSYEFALTVTDASGASETDYVKYTVRAAPPLKIKPAPERRFELRNGYRLPHFTSWVTNLESYEAVFEIASPGELTLTKVAGDACEVSGGQADGAYSYQVVVYGQAGQASSWVEFLVDTEDKIPAIIQLGANWEAR